MAIEYYEVTIGSQRKEALQDLLAIISLRTALNQLLDIEQIQERCHHGNNVTIDPCDDCDIIVAPI